MFSRDDLEMMVRYGRKRFADEPAPLPTSKDTRITLHPHYSNPQFDGKGEVEIWGRKVEGLNYVYSDRLWQWDSTKARAALKHANANATQSTARWVEAYLSHYEGQPVEVCHIYAGVFPHSGYSYWVAGYKAKA